MTPANPNAGPGLDIDAELARLFAAWRDIPEPEQYDKGERAYVARVAEEAGEKE